MAIAVSFFVMIVAVAVSSGFRAAIRDGVAAMVGDIRIQPRDLSQGEMAAMPRTLPSEEALLAVPGVKSIRPVVLRSGVVKDGDRILIAEGCTHHRQEDDIGTVKIPRLLRAKTGRELVFEHCSGVGYPPDLASYALVVHCGACMLNRREMLARIEAARAAGVPIVNYGVLLAALNGILPRAIEPLAAG